jgi:hypothetical protein
VLFLPYLKVPSGQIRSAGEWYQWIGLEKYIKLEYLIRVQSSELLHAKINPTPCLFGSQLERAQLAIFSKEPCSKNAGETSIVL